MNVDLQKVKEKRKKIIKNAIKKEKFNLYVFSQYFETRTITVKHDINELFGSDFTYENSNDITLEQLQKKRNNYIKRNKDKMTKEELLENLGMWHMPIQLKQSISLLCEYANVKNPKESEIPLQQAAITYMKNPTEKNKSVFLYVAEQYIPHFSDCLTSFQIGISKQDLIEQHHLTTFQVKKMTEFFKVLGLGKTQNIQLLQHPEVTEAIDSILENNKNMSQISKIIGINCDVLAQYQKSDNQFIKETKETPYQIKIRERREKVWNLYNKYGSSFGLTEQEIADQLNITRTTVSTDLRAYKTQNPQLIDATQLYRPRHTGEQNHIKREVLKQKISFAYNTIKEFSPDLSDSQIIMVLQKKTLKSPEMLYSLLIESKTIVPYQDKTVDKSEIQKASEEAYIGVKNKGQFGNGSTTKILNIRNVSPETKAIERNKILRHQRDTMALIRNNENHKQLFLKTESLQKVLEVIQEDPTPIKYNSPQKEYER